MDSVVGAPDEKAGIGYIGLVHVRRTANMDMTPNAEVRGDAPLYGAASLSTDVLERCPFCGGSARIISDGGSGLGSTAACNACHASLDGEDDADAIKKWNMRSNIQFKGRE